LGSIFDKMEPERYPRRRIRRTDDDGLRIDPGRQIGRPASADDRDATKREEDRFAA
jgi:hypothetical protein